MSISSTPTHAAPNPETPSEAELARHSVTPSDIAVGVIIGRTSEFFDFFVFAIASVIVFPTRIFAFAASPLEATLWSFALFALAFVARPFGTMIFSALDRRYGKVAKLTVALFLLGTSTVGMGLVPSWEQAGIWAVVSLAVLRIGQGLALGGAWDGLPSLLAIMAPKGQRGLYAMVPQLGAPIALIVASGLFAYLVYSLSAADFLDWGWRYPFFVAFAVNVVALFARLRIVATPEYAHQFESRELQPSSIRETLKTDGKQILAGTFVPLGSFALFHMVTVFPLSWVYLYTEQPLINFLLIEAVAAGFGLGAVLLSGLLADIFGRRNLLIWGAWAIVAFSLLAPPLLSFGQTGEAVFLIAGFLILGVNFGQSSGAVASLFDARNRYTASALVSDLAWMFGAGFAPLTALLLAHWLGLYASGLYLLSGAICTLLALWWVRHLDFRGVQG